MGVKISTSFTRGFSRVLDLTGVKEWPDISNDKMTDYKAIRSDWENVGRSIERETRRYKRSEIDCLRQTE